MDSTSRRKVLLDGDFGIDDALAALYLSSELGVEIVGVGSVHGNAPADTAARNALGVLKLAGLDQVPVAVGAARPLAQPAQARLHVHGRDGLGGASSLLPRPTARPGDIPAAMQLVEVVRRHPGAVTVLATGPLTNLALAVLLDPGVVGAVERVVLMGGALDGPGNVGARVEANFGHDPEAADLVLTAGWPVTMVGLDVTTGVRLEPEELERIEGDESDRGHFSWAILQHYLAFYEERDGRSGCPLHDPTAAVLAVHASLASYRELPLRVELRSAGERGRVLPSGSDGPVRVAATVERDRVVDRFLTGLLGG